MDFNSSNITMPATRIKEIKATDSIEIKNQLNKRENNFLKTMIILNFLPFSPPDFKKIRFISPAKFVKF